MNVTVRLFARARDLAGTDTTRLELPDGATVASMRRRLVEEHPALESLSSHLLVAVNNEYLTDAAAVPAGAEVAMFPPVSGG